jgi:hypothetical protein
MKIEYYKCGYDEENGRFCCPYVLIRDARLVEQDGAFEESFESWYRSLILCTSNGVYDISVRAGYMDEPHVVLKDLQDAIEKVIEWTNAKNLDDMRDQHRHIDMSMSELLPTFGVEFEEKEC